MSRLRLFITALVSGLLACSPVRLAGSELDPVPIGEVELAPGVSATPSPGRTVQRAILATRPTFSYNFVHAEGVLTAPGIKNSTSVHSASASLNWNLGESMMLRYRPSWSHYSNNNFQDNFGHTASLQWQRGFVDWNVRAMHTFRRASLPLVETARQTQLNTHITSLQAQRMLGPRSTLELGLNQSLRQAENFPGNKEWSSHNWLHYQVTPSIAAAGGLGFGYVRVDRGTDMNVRQLRGRLRWILTDKVHLDAQAGVERRKFIGTPLQDSDTPVFGGSLVYRLLENTTFTFGADRAVEPSLFQNQVNRSVSWQAGFSQRLLGRFNFQTHYVRRESSFRASQTDVIANREDTGDAIHFRLGTEVFNRGSVSAFYQRNKNDSSDPLYGFSGNQWGFELGFRY